MEETLTPIGHYLGVDIFENESGQKVIIVNDKREQFRLNVRAWNYIYSALQTRKFVARSGQLFSKYSITVTR
tara:strand:- start:2940 stop:3155 length:216 start_codon:yes stop_codon:yes gene_type:complete